MRTNKCLGVDAQVPIMALECTHCADQVLIRLVRIAPFNLRSCWKSRHRSSADERVHLRLFGHQRSGDNAGMDMRRACAHALPEVIADEAEVNVEVEVGKVEVFRILVRRQQDRHELGGFQKVVREDRVADNANAGDVVRYTNDGIVR